MLHGRHAVVTGGGKGIGLAIAGALRRRGASVSVISRSAEVPADISRAQDVTRAFDALRAQNGPIHILVNNAGVAESAPLARTDVAMWERTIATNLTGTFLCTRAVIDDMLREGWGRIVNIASIAGLYGAPYLSAYCASKHGVIGLTRTWSAELADTGITVNALCPGYAQTEMLDRAIANIAARTGRSVDDARAGLADRNPGNRLVDPQEVAQAAVALCESDQTGAEIILPRD